jgi:hypothetical protein
MGLSHKVIAGLTCLSCLEGKPDGKAEILFDKIESMASSEILNEAVMSGKPPDALPLSMPLVKPAVGYRPPKFLSIIHISTKPPGNGPVGVSASRAEYRKPRGLKIEAGLPVRSRIQRSASNFTQKDARKAGDQRQNIQTEPASFV